ncbi:SWIM zinc finger family protein [Nonomuraea aurantiaca]|uniref:SWIM zinc finger family protein n=1 Tax=Nonomuraea aurantiaca TaxID=2878562 RepID=UPI001CDA1882|nr:SWIM zinc finger family protein [Nonomuraea aurantiaca]MCA2223563.1 SWIM zinc finger family protein [Nonomuraea aurantiaca]
MSAVRGFPAFPAQRAGARFATSWWGGAWIQAMEDTSLDHTLLRKGRTYAKSGQVGPITVSPGRIAAVAESEYDTVVHVEQLTAPDWERFLDQVAAKAGHIAALLDRDMPHDLVEAAEDAGVPLLPTVGDLEPECSCPDWGHPCKHAAALCYQASWLLDADPFVLLLMRGRGEQELLEALQGRDIPAPADAGTPAAVAFSLGVPPLPGPPPLDVAYTPLGLEPAPGVDVAALEVLAASAADRARELLLTGRLAVLTEYQDRVRLAAAHDLDLGLEAAVQAWRYGGADGLEALETAWTPPKQDLARAGALLRAGWEGERPPQVEAWRNRWTIGARQLRYGRDGRWYPFTDRDGQWWPAGPPERDPSALVS